MSNGLSIADLLGMIVLSALLGAIGGTMLTVILFFIFQEQIANILLKSLLI